MKEMTRDLLTWYKEHKRDLPWRKNKNAYYIWVSEIMLQQTRVEAVKPYFTRFIHTLPTIYDLANCEEDELMKLWEGLGYYSRVRNMQECAKTCVQQYNGQLPNTYEQLVTLKGIGPYTAGAIASIAYNEKVSAVDGNVLRVFSRLFVIEEDIMKQSTKNKITKLVESYLPEDASSYNQALMELGATICIPNGAPRCSSCPLQTYCEASKQGIAHTLPVKQKKKERRMEEKTVVLVLCNGKIHLQQRPSQGLLANLYTFDVFDGSLSEAQIQALYHKQQVQSIRVLQDAKHIFSHVEWHMKGYLIEVKKQSNEGIYCSLLEMKELYAIPSAFSSFHKVLGIHTKKNN